MFTNKNVQVLCMKPIAMATEKDEQVLCAVRCHELKITEQCLHNLYDSCGSYACWSCFKVFKSCQCMIESALDIFHKWLGFCIPKQ